MEIRAPHRDHLRVAVIGVGNEFRRDDGTGWAVVTALAERAQRRSLPSDTRLLVCDGEPARLISLWEDTDVAIVVDSAHADPAEPGRVHRLELTGGRLTQDRTTTSSHGLGLGDAVELASLLERLPDKLIVYAVEVTDYGLGEGLSAPVAATVGSLADHIADEIFQLAVSAPPTVSHQGAPGLWDGPMAASGAAQAFPTTEIGREHPG